MLRLPNEEKSLWREAYPASLYPQLVEDLKVDVVIVGGGITGLTSAYLLKQAGFKIAVLEKRTVGSGTTGRTTGKVTSQHNLIYDDLASRLGQNTAKIYGEANQAAVQQIEEIIQKEKIKCGWQREDNYVYTDDPEQIDKFKQEARIAADLGLPATFETDTPLPFAVQAAVKFKDQAKIHSQKYLLGLAKAIDGNGSYVFENSSVLGIRDGNPGRVKSKEASMFAKNIIVATNVPSFPLMARGGYCLLEYPTESYIVAGLLKQELEGMYISPDERHYSLLHVKAGGKSILLIGGESNISGMKLGKSAKYQRLANYAKEYFRVTEFIYKWSDRDYLSYDGPPLVGKLYPWSKNLYVASAFRKWGLTNGTVAAMILSDLIAGKENPWASVFNSNRTNPIKSIPRLAAKYIAKALS